jgi:hypothetical protein
MANITEDNAIFSVKFNNLLEEESNNKEPSSLKQLNTNINDNMNKIQQYQNDIQAKNNLIENKLIQIKDDENFILEVEQEKQMYMENITEEVLSELSNIKYTNIIGSEFEQIYQYKLIKFLFEHIFKISLTNEVLDENDVINLSDDMKLFNNENIRAKIFKLFKKQMRKWKEFLNKLVQSQESFQKLDSEKLRELNQNLENIKIEAELGRKDKFYDKFFFPMFKCLKLMVFISLGKIRIEKLKETIENVNTYNNIY